MYVDSISWNRQNSSSRIGKRTLTDGGPLPEKSSNTNINRSSIALGLLKGKEEMTNII